METFHENEHEKLPPEQVRNPRSGFGKFFICCGLWTLLIGCWGIAEGYFPSQRVMDRHPDPEDPFWWENRVLIPAMMPLAIPYLYLGIALLKRHFTKFNFYLGLTLLLLGLDTKLALVFIVLLWNWFKLPERRLFLVPAPTTDDV